MTAELLKIECAEYPEDFLKLLIDVNEKLNVFAGDGEFGESAKIILNPETAEQLRDALTEWLEAQ